MKRATPAQLNRRRMAAFLLLNKGYQIGQIRDALGVASSSTVTEDLRIVAPNRKLRDRSGPLLPDPEPVDWRSEPEPGTDYTDPVLRLTRSFVSEMRRMNYRNAFAHAVREARSKEDVKWLEGARAAVEDLAMVTLAARLILDDPEYREKMATTREGRDDLTRMPR